MFLTGKAVLVPLKAFAAPYMLDYAWQRSLERNEAVKPWWWLDSEPVAKLSFEERNVSFVVLKGVTGNVLAFAPGLSENAAKMNGRAQVISAHRDTHFSILQHIKIGEFLKLQDIQGQERRFKVNDIFVTDMPKLRLPKGEAALYLVTCFPFNDWGKNPQQRYIVKAELWDE